MPIRDAKKTTLLPLRFHDTFNLERTYIHALMRFVAGGNKGTLQEISEMAGIPMGKSTGKVQPTIYYCMGMGLLTPMPGKHEAGIKALELTAFGKKVFLEDKLLNYPITQWIAHFNMCHPCTGASAWVHTFADGYPAPLGRTFSLEQLNDHLRVFFPKAKKLVGPLVGIYSEPASLATCGALKENKGVITRIIPPLNDEMFRGYGAWLLQLLEDFFSGRVQIPLNELQKATKWRNITGWSAEEEAILFTALEQRGLLTIDRHMEPWFLTMKTSAGQAWLSIYDDLL